MSARRIAGLHSADTMQCHRFGLFRPVTKNGITELARPTEIIGQPGLRRFGKPRVHHDAAL